MANLAHNMMTQFIPFFELFVLALNVFSIVILIWGVSIAGYDFIKNEFSQRDRVWMTKQNNFIKNYLGSYVLLSLEVLIAADIIESILKPTFQDILKLGIVVIIRTVISFFLHKEIEEAMNVDDEKNSQMKNQKTD